MWAGEDGRGRREGLCGAGEVRSGGRGCAIHHKLASVCQLSAVYVKFLVRILWSE